MPIPRPSLPRRLPFDPYIAALLATVGLALLLPARGVAAPAVSDAAEGAVALLFFLYGARLSTREAVQGLKQWRLHGTVLAVTFGLFPLLGLACRALVPELLSPQLYQGLLFLCLLPSTVQSSIAFTSIARGNTAAAVCSATFSSLFGIVLTPLLAAALLSTRGGISAGAVLGIAEQLLLPFLAGQLLRGRLVGWMGRHRALLGLVDRGSVLLVVYSAFGAGVVGGIWGQLSLPRLAVLFLVEAVLLTVVLTVTLTLGRRLGFNRADRIAIVFCGSKKSLAAGVPMASVLFPGPAAGLLVLPLMLFHQLQLMVCAILARRWARRPPGTEPVVAGQAATPSSVRVRWTKSATRASRRQGVSAVVNSRT
ncbi:sodium/bile acid cotransporter 7 [Kitasatospora sp. MAP12-15]|uniref:bile acid:sodium symporter family protein n=1 Tax=unclassified Kitasatospora TaxID=2633591 RepID=UPI0024756C7C|nr:bile acid:sodium symporter family protein [Kitasatospora sp. MAP12-44]MDH6114946.1 sodium/bile acid cotransporter 7 [Kitasatospora sp. MAP12-44]